MTFLAKTWLRWLSWFLLASLFAASCVGLASWQFDRRDQAVSKVQRMVDNYEKPAVSFGEIADLSLDDVTGFEWTPVELTGSYRISDELLVRNRPIAGQPGFLQIVPFELSSGQLVLIERGWIPADSNLAPAKSFTPDTQTKTVVARVRLSELTPNRDSPVGFVTSLHLESLAEQVDPSLEQQFYLRLMSESPGEPSSPQPMRKPILDEGNHLSYAVQWIMFALMGFFALFWAIRQEREFQRMDKDPTYVPRSQRSKKRTDGDVEDELLDASSKR
jgi:cytochrome oxidase assembly protein ShyY1